MRLDDHSCTYGVKPLNEDDITFINTFLHDGEVVGAILQGNDDLLYRVVFHLVGKDLTLLLEGCHLGDYHHVIELLQNQHCATVAVR